MLQVREARQLFSDLYGPSGLDSPHSKGGLDVVGSVGRYNRRGAKNGFDNTQMEIQSQVFIDLKHHLDYRENAVSEAIAFAESQMRACSFHFRNLIASDVAIALSELPTFPESDWRQWSEWCSRFRDKSVAIAYADSRASYRFPAVFDEIVQHAKAFQRDARLDELLQFHCARLRSAVDQSIHSHSLSRRTRSLARNACG